jgi:UTP--glucose-1-phosphate uridylyltransferase
MSRNHRNIIAFIPAAGLAERLFPITKFIPKEMFPIGNKPVIHHIIDRIRDAGITDCIIGINPNKKSIKQYLGNGEKFGVRIRYVIVPPYGINTTLWYGLQKIGDRPFLYCVGDIFIKNSFLIKQLLQQYNTRKASILALQRIPKIELKRFAVPAVSRISKLLWKIHSFVEKPDRETQPSAFASVGIMILTPSFKRYVHKPKQRKEIQLSRFISSFAAQEDVFGYEIQSPVYDCSKPKEYAHAVNANIVKT